jgi:SWI/SNF-related matrix-associated actin-dependent regulator of chromatin subfamily D
VKRTLRVFLSNTAHDQEWQKQQEAKPEGAVDGEGAAAPPPQPQAVDMDNGKNIPGWLLRVEGRLLDVS